MTRPWHRSLVAFAAMSAASALSACFPMSDLGPYDRGVEIPRTPGAVAREFKLDGVPWAPIPIAKYSGATIAQLIVMPVPRAVFIPVETLPDSLRGEGGFGSTGYQKDGVLA